MTERLAMFMQPQRTSTSVAVWRLELAPQAEGLVREPRVARVEVVVAERAGPAVGRGHRIADPPALEDDDARAPLGRVVGGEAAHHAAADDDEVAQPATQPGRSSSA